MNAQNKRMCGIYYLWDGASVIYVGSSINVEKRIAQHAHGDLDFCGYFVDSCPRNKLREMEAAAIAEFKPIYNVRSELGFEG